LAVSTKDDKICIHLSFVYLRGGEEGTWGLQQLGHLCLFLIDGVFSATSWNLKTKFHTAVLHIECSEAAVWGVYNRYVHEAAFWMTG
jgi:hypothetical protein